MLTVVFHSIFRFLNSTFRSIPSKLLFRSFRVDKEAGTITGSVLQAPDSVGRSEGSPVASSMELWSIVFPKETEQIAAVFGRRPEESVHSQVSLKCCSYEDTALSRRNEAKI